MNQDNVLSRLGSLSGMSVVPRTNEEFSYVGGSLHYGDHLLSENAIGDAARWSSIPILFLKRCDDDMQTMLLNHFFEKMSYSFPSIVLQNSNVVSFVGAGTELLDISGVVGTVFNSVPSADVDRVILDQNWINLYVSTPERQEAVVKGDVINGGALLRFSPYAGKPEIMPYLLRLVCTNGLTKVETSTRFTASYGRDLYEWIAEKLPIACESVFDEVKIYRRMRGVRMNGNTSSFLSHAIGSLPNSVQQTIRDLVMDERPETLYDMMNLITYYASHEVEDPSMISMLMATGGEISAHYDICPSCHRIMD